MQLSDRALLVQLNISQWTARKLDKRATQQVNAANNAGSAAGRYNKSLLPTSDLLGNISSKTALIRGKFLDNTLPWGIKGTQMLPAANYLSFMQEFRKEKAEWEYIAKQFLDNYDTLRVDAQRILGDLYDPSDYPYIYDLQDKFSIDMAVFPVPTNDFRVQISDAELSSIQSDVERRVTEASQNAMRDVWKRLYDKVEWLAGKMSNPDSVIQERNHSDVADLCSLLSRLNFVGDPNLEQMRKDVERKLAGHQLESLRNDPAVRKTVAADAADIMDKMRGFMGGAQ